MPSDLFDELAHFLIEELSLTRVTDDAKLSDYYDLIGQMVERLPDDKLLNSP